jgi:adenylate cyclase
LPFGHAEALAMLRQGSELTKTRFRVPYAGRIWEVDVYSGDNAGLVVAEIELENDTASVKLPSWLGREVTGDHRYYAASLSQHPYRSWTSAERRGGV